MSINITTLYTGPLDVNTYMLPCGNGECIAVDPADARPVADWCAKEGLSCKWVLLTHGHFDHMLGVAALQQAGAKVYIHRLDAEALYNDTVNLGVMGGGRCTPCRADVLLEGGETLNIGELEIGVIHTPGHTRGGVCYLLKAERVLISGDTLFRMSVGRSDLPGGSAKQLHDSIRDRLFTLPGDYRVLPGHMGESMLEQERRLNPFMNTWGYEAW